jgi:hypothetical protein
MGNAIGMKDNCDDIGGLIGFNNGGKVNNCTAFGNAIGTYHDVGGLIGWDDMGIVTNCTAYGDAYGGGDSVGGLIGREDGGWVAYCTAYGNATGTNATSDGIGGLIGWNFGVEVNNCTAYGDATGIFGFIGGLIGANDVSGTVTMCRSFGDAIGTDPNTDYVGGLIGMLYTGTIENCYAHGDVTGDDEVGGLIGNNSGATVKNCYSIGLVTGDVNASGLVGKNDGTITGCFWDNMTSGHTTSDGGTGLNTTEMYRAITFTGAGWDFTNIWAIKEGFSYPYFGWHPWIDPPMITTIDQVLAYEDVLYSIVYVAVDPDFEVLTWTGADNTTWLTFDTNTQLLSGTPLQIDIGIYWVNITVEDPNGLTDFTNFTITVLNTNDAPVITTIDVETTNEDELYSVDYDATDIDPTNDTLTWSLWTNAGWLNIDAGTGVLSGTPDNSDVGSYWVEVTVDDGNDGNHSTNFTLTVNNVNDDPTIISPLPPHADAVEDTLYYLDFEADDIDLPGDTLTWHLTTDAGWLAIDDVTGNISGTPTNDDVGDSWVNISVDDGNLGSDWQNFTLTVTNVNDDPVITTTDVTTATAGELYSVDYEATDIDPAGDTLTWSLVSNASWLSIVSGTGVLSGTPTNDDVGAYNVNVSVNDGNGGSDVNSFTLSVEPGVVVTNLNPNITTADDLTATVDELYSVTYDATDDRTLPADLVWTMTTNASWLSFDSVTRVLSGTPVTADVGSYWALISVNDGEGGSASTNFTVVVSEAVTPSNTDPDLTQGRITPTSGDTDTTFTFSVHYTDADGDAPVSITVVIDGTEHDMTLATGDAADGTYEYETTLTEGNHTYYFKANDGTADAITTDGTPLTSADALTTTEVTLPIEPEEEDDEDDEGLFSGMTLWLILIIVIIIIVLLLAMAMRKKPSEEEALLAAEEEEEIAEEMAAEEEPVADEGAEEETKEEVETFECPTCGAEIAEDDTVCPECGEEFDDE